MNLGFIRYTVEVSERFEMYYKVGVGATGLILSLRKPARETSGHQILFQYSWAFP